MLKRILNWSVSIIGLCLLCCAAPLTALFLGGGALAGTALLSDFLNDAKAVLIIAGLATMTAAAFAIWWRMRKGAVCEIPKP
jgi:hypothetical protein